MKNLVVVFDVVVLFCYVVYDEWYVLVVVEMFLVLIEVVLVEWCDWIVFFEVIVFVVVVYLLNVCGVWDVGFGCYDVVYCVGVYIENVGFDDLVVCVGVGYLELVG